MDNSASQLLQIIVQELPTHAEEGAVATDKTRAALLDVFAANGVETSAAIAVIALIERLLISTCLLEPAALTQSIWRWMSYPASLLGRSLLNSLADDQQRWFVKDFWRDDTGRYEEQRQILHTLETRRCNYHVTRTAQPIRCVHVVWAFLQIEGRFLFHQREDRLRSEVANYVPLGGRLKVDDFPDDISPAQRLQWLQSPHEINFTGVNEHGLEREIEEETGLLLERHYTFTPWLVLRPLQKIEGKAANMAYTAYFIRCFCVTLNRDGLFHLMNRLCSDDTLCWLTAEDIAQGEQQGGRRVFVDALQQHFAGNQQQLIAALQTIPNSYANDWPLTKNEEVIVLPWQEDQFLRGVAGKEKAISCTLTHTEKAILLHLGWHGRGLEWTPTEGVLIGLQGWIQLQDASLLEQVHHIGVKLEKANLALLQSGDQGWVRLRISPKQIFFRDSVFSIEVDKTNLVFKTRLEATPLGQLKIFNQHFDLANHAPTLKDIRNQVKVGQDELGGSKNALEMFVQRNIMDAGLERVGLRKLLPVEKKCYRLAGVRDNFIEKPE